MVDTTWTQDTATADFDFDENTMIGEGAKTASSAFIGYRITDVKFYLWCTSPTGSTITCGRFNSSYVLQHTYWTLSTSSLTGSVALVQGTMIEDTQNIAEGDIIGVQVTSGTDDVKVNGIHSDLFDGVNSAFVRSTSGYNTGLDLGFSITGSTTPPPSTSATRLPPPPLIARF